jgi:hypothetical protein
MADEKKPRNIVHIHEGDDLVIHWEMGLVLLSKAQFAGYKTGGESPPQVMLDGFALRTMLPPGHTLEVAEVQPQNVNVAVDQLEAAELPVLKD